MRRFGALFFACHFNGTFNLPGLADYVLRHTNTAAEIGGKTNGTLPNITGQFSSSNAIYVNATGAFKVISGSTEWVGSIKYTGQNLWLDFNASRSASVYVGGINYVRPKSILVRYVIKYI